MKGGYNMSRLKDLAKKSVTANNIMAGREKISVDDIIMLYPNGISINSVNMVTYFDKTTREDKSYPVFGFSEDNGKFFSGGVALKRIVDNWLEQCGGDIAVINEELQAENVKIKMEKVKTNSNRTFVKVEILD